MRKFNIKVNGTAYAVEVEEVSGGASGPAPIVAAPAPVKQAPAPAAPAAPAASAGGTAIKSPMPGDIRKLNFADGALVRSGDKIAVLEAMKMENDIVTMSGGSITYAVKVGDHIETGAVIAYIK